MSLIRKLNNGTWNKPPVLTAARLVFAKGLAEKYPARELGDLAEFVNGTSYDRGRLDMGDTPIIRISNITDPQSDFIKTDERFPDRYHVSRGDLLVSWSASFKSILWPGPDGILNQHIFKVTERDGHARNYIRHAIEAAFDEMQRNVVGMGMMHLRRGDFLGHSVPCPPTGVQRSVADYLDWVESGCDGEEPRLPEELSEQRRIVAKIERLAAKINEAHGLREQSSREASLLVNGALSRIFNDQMDNTWAGECLGDFIADDCYGTSEKTLDEPLGVPILRMGNIQNGRIDAADLKYLPIADKDRDKWLLQRGDILVNRTNSAELVGKCAVFAEDGEWGFASYLIRLRLDANRADPRLVSAYINSPTGRAYMFRERKQMTGQANVNAKKLKALPLKLPPLEEQRRIVAYLDGLQTKVDHLKALQQKTAAELDALLPSILDKAFKGEL